MNKSIQCPKCSSENVVFSKKRGVNFCEDCGFEFTPEVPISPLRIFLSYGHDASEELVRMIKTDLEKRGHDVWFDKSEIKFGDDWRRDITDGVIKSNRVLSFLSKHSTRDPGVCRDEIAIAIGVKGGNIQTILVDDEKEVQAPVNIGHIQWLDMHDWKAKHELGEKDWNEWYQSKFDEIIRVVESDESRRFAGEIELLNGYLKPIKSDSRIYSLLNKGFIGRDWLFEAVEKWRSGTPSPLGGEGGGVGLSRLFWITGDPGVGKSAFAAQLTHTHGDSVIASQFVEWDKPDHRNAQNVIRSIAFQLATRLPDYRKFLLTLPEIKELERKNPSELFDYLLANPLKHAIDGGRERYLIVIDALDEAGESGHNQLVELLARDAHRLPEWLGIIVTSRPESAVKTPLQGLNPLVLDTSNEANKNDIREYLLHHLASQLKDRTNINQIIGQILEKSEGVFLYAERFCDDVRQNHISLDHPDQFPQGLGGIFFQYFQRQFPVHEIYEKTIEPMLGAILAAREPLPVEILQKLFNWKETELRKWLRILGSLFPVATESGNEVIKPYHKSLSDWLVDEKKAGKYFVSMMEGHKMLADYYWLSFLGNVNSMERGEAEVALHHFEEIGLTILHKVQPLGKVFSYFEWLGLQIVRFKVIRPHYFLLLSLLRSSFHELAPLADIQGRVKSEMAFFMKIMESFEDLNDPLLDLLDICAFHVIIHTEEEFKTFCQSIERCYDVDTDKCSASSFSFFPRYVIKLRSCNSLFKELSKSLQKQLSETHTIVEVRTLFDHERVKTNEMMEFERQYKDMKKELSKLFLKNHK
jgi:hypothetical protein